MVTRATSSDVRFQFANVRAPIHSPYVASFGRVSGVFVRWSSGGVARVRAWVGESVSEGVGRWFGRCTG
jgi:hypothetical protein